MRSVADESGAKVALNSISDAVFLPIFWAISITLILLLKNSLTGQVMPPKASLDARFLILSTAPTTNLHLTLRLIY